MPIPFLVKSVKNLSSKSNNNTFSWPGLVEWWSMTKSKDVLRRIKPYLSGKKILDIGFGAGTVGKLLVDHGYDLTGLDVADLSIYSDLKATIYDGHHFPFKDNSFDTAVIIHVLHHCPDGMQVLSEALRCAKRVIFIEDTFRNSTEKALVSFNDQVGNFEFYFHPYFSSTEWQSKLKQLKTKVVATNEYSVLSPIGLPSRYCLFVVEKE